MCYRAAYGPLHSTALELEPPPPSTDEFFWTACCASLFGLLMLAYMSYPDNPSISNPFVSLFILCAFLTFISHLVASTADCVGAGISSLSRTRLVHLEDVLFGSFIRGMFVSRPGCSIPHPNHDTLVPLFLLHRWHVL